MVYLIKYISTIIILLTSVSTFAINKVDLTVYDINILRQYGYDKKSIKSVPYDKLTVNEKKAVSLFFNELKPLFAICDERHFTSASRGILELKNPKYYLSIALLETNQIDQLNNVDLNGVMMFEYRADASRSYYGDENAEWSKYNGHPINRPFRLKNGELVSSDKDPYGVGYKTFINPKDYIQICPNDPNEMKKNYAIVQGNRKLIQDAQKPNQSPQEENKPSENPFKKAIGSIIRGAMNSN